MCTNLTDPGAAACSTLKRAMLGTGIARGSCGHTKSRLACLFQGVYVHSVLLHWHLPIEGATDAQTPCDADATPPQPYRMQQ